MYVCIYVSALIGAACVVYVFSTINKVSFDNIPQWRKRVEDECGPDICSVLVQNKVDLLQQSELDKYVYYY